VYVCNVYTYWSIILSGVKRYNTAWQWNARNSHVIFVLLYLPIYCLKIPTVIVIGWQLRISFQKQRAPRMASLNIHIQRAVLLEHERDGNGCLLSLFWLSHVWKTNLTGWSVYRIVLCDKSWRMPSCAREKSSGRSFRLCRVFPF